MSSSSTLAGTGLLLRLDLRRDRILAPVWIAVLLMMTIASAAATPSLYKTRADLERAAHTINSSPAIVALQPYASWNSRVKRNGAPMMIMR